MDVLTRKTYPRKDLYRLVVREEEVLFDKDNTLPGRGFYLYRDKEKIRLAIQTKKLNRFTKGRKLDPLFVKEIEG
ncbi:MAG: DUF448 domain-containing protein [Bacilli bacterium]|jgi:predicted RNA-binding protein YlxR (DUF448 family)|nr:DUF448 domain-containing protein [Bacilli bacterium]